MTDVSGGSPANGPVDIGSGNVRPVDLSARPPHVLVSVRSALAILALIAFTILVLEIAQHAQRVIAWVLVAGALAVLVYPVVKFGSRWLPRGVVVLLLVVVGLGTLGFVSYRIVNDVTQATDRIQVAAPRRAAELEKNSEFLRGVHLRRRVQRLVDDIPQRLAGGSATAALESAATRGVAFVAGLILTIFFVLYGPGLFTSGLEQIRDPDRRTLVERVVVQGSRRGLDYARVKLLEAVIGGVLAYVIARAAGVPGPAALGVWAGLWTLLPVAGVFVGALPIVVFAGASSVTRAVVVALAFVAIGIAEYVLNGYLERETVEVGSFLVVFAAFAGLELYGLTGALLGVFGIVVLIAILDEYAREEETLETVESVTPRRE
jgi:predicted PurR-regulated permease PerM